MSEAQSAPSPTRQVGSVRSPQGAPKLSSLFRIDGQRALIVGGYGGIGEIVTRLLVGQGAGGAAARRSREKADALAAALEAEGAEAIGTQVDIADRESAVAVVG